MALIINEFRRAGNFDNATGNEYIEFLLTADLTAAEMEALYFGDSLNPPNAKYSSYRFTNLSNIATTFKAGTIIVVKGQAPSLGTQDLLYNPIPSGTNDDWNIQLQFGKGFIIHTNPANGGDFAANDAVWIDSSNTGVTSIDSIAWSSPFNPTTAALGAAAKVQITGLNNNSNVEFIGDGSQINQVAAYAVNSGGSLGLPNIGNNTTYINSLRSSGVAAGITITASDGTMAINEIDATTDTYAIALTAIPVAPVILQLDVTDGQTQVSTDGTTFANSVTLSLSDTNPVTITVKAVDDFVAEGNHTSTITHSITSSGDPAYSNTLTPIPDINLTITDNDTAGITVSSISGNTLEAGNGATFTVVLNSQPTETVSVSLTSDNTSEGIVSTPTLAFSPNNWNTPQSVTVIGVDDAVDDGDITYNIITNVTSDDPTYNTLTPVGVALTNIDNDGPGLIITQSDGNTTVTQDGDTDTYEVVLNTIPTEPVTVTIDPDDSINAGAGAGNPITLVFAADSTALIPQTVTVTSVDTPVANFTSSLTHSVTSADPNYNSASLPITVDGTPTAEVITVVTTNTTLPPTLRNTSNNVFLIEGDSGIANLQFTLAQNGASLVNEVGVFQVDDEQGTVDGVTPGTPGYLQAALSRANVIFSALPGDFVANPTRILNGFAPNSRLVFYLVPNSTTEAVLAGQPTPVFFSSSSFNADGAEYMQVLDRGNGTFTLAWEDQQGGSNYPNASANSDRDFDDLVVNVQLTDQPPSVGTSLQGHKELIDLRDQSNLIANIQVTSEAAFNNTVGLYWVEDEQGTVIDPVTGTRLTPSQDGYQAAAIKQTVLQFGRDVTSSVQLDGNTLLAPYIIANGTAAEFLAANPDHQQGQNPFAYFAYLEANPDGMDHIRLLGDNTFAFEDIFGGGDRDFNDIVFQIDFA